jgi:hypothetical protein
MGLSSDDRQRILRILMSSHPPLIASDRRLDGGLRLKTIADLVWHDVMPGNRNKLNPDFLLVET